MPVSPVARRPLSRARPYLPGVLGYIGRRASQDNASRKSEGPIVLEGYQSGASPVALHGPLSSAYSGPPRRGIRGTADTVLPNGTG